MTDAMVVRRLIGILASPSLGVRRDIAAAALGEMIGIGLTVGAPYSLKVLVDTLPLASLPSSVLVLSIAAFVLTWSGASLTGAFRLVFTTRIVDRLAEQLAADAMASELPRTALTTDGDASRTSSALERLPFSLQIIIEGVAGRVLPLSLQLAIALGLIGLAAPPRYAAMMAGVIIAFLAAAQAGASDFQRRADAVNGSLAALSAVVGDLFHNSGRVVFNGALTSELGHVAALAARRRQADVALAARLATMTALQYGALSLGLGILLLSAARDVQAHRLPVGDFVLLQAYAFRLALPLSGLGLIWRQAGAALANVKDVLGMIKTQDSQRYGAPPTGGALRLMHVSYSYDVSGRGVDDVSFTIPPGATVAIVGPNGSGKSTLARLIAGLQTPDSGTVAVGDVEINTLPLAGRPAWVLYVPQFIGLLNRTLEDNGRYPPSALTTAELTSALDRWRFESGGGLDLKRMVGTRGALLSGGQVQKLELARLIGISAPVLVLDEATSALDAASARRALLDLRSAHPDQILIAVTHSADVARWVDRVLYLEAGKLVADGPHNVLMVSSPEYAALWRPMDN